MSKKVLAIVPTNIKKQCFNKRIPKEDNEFIQELIKNIRVKDGILISFRNISYKFYKEYCLGTQYRALYVKLKQKDVMVYLLILYRKKNDKSVENIHPKNKELEELLMSLTPKIISEFTEGKAIFFPIE